MEQKSKLNVSELDFSGIKTNLINFLKHQDQFKNFDFAGSNLDVILDLLSYNTYYNSYYLNMVANELFLDTAALRNSVVQKAKMLGYTPRSVLGSRAQIDLQVFPSDNPSSIVIERGIKFKSLVGDKSYIFTVPEAQTITPANNVYKAENLVITQGQRLVHRYTVDLSNKEQKFVLPNPDTDVTTLVVQVKESATDSNVYSYSKATDALAVTSTSNVYFCYETFDNKFEVQFGDGKVGRKLSDGNQVILEAAIAEGPDTNKAASFELLDTIGGYANTTVTTKVKGYGGALRETVEEIKYNAPKLYETQNRAVTLNDYKRIVQQQYTDADSVIAWGGEDNVPPMYGKVFVAVKPKSTDEITTDAKNVIKEKILKDLKIVSITPEIVNPDYLYLRITDKVRYDPNLATKSAREIAKDIITSVLNYNNNEIGKFDLRFRFSRLSYLIDTTDPSIINNELEVSLFKQLKLELKKSFNYTMNFSNKIYYPYVGYKGALSSTFFDYINESTKLLAKNCKLDDKDGVVRVVKEEGGRIAQIAANVGTINYNNGQIKLVNFTPQEVNPIVIDEKTIKVYVQTAAQDITPVREQILSILAADVSVNMITDTSRATGTQQATGSYEPSVTVVGATY